MEKETGVEISPSIFPGIPQWEKFDFFIVLMSLPISNGLVFFFLLLLVYFQQPLMILQETR